MVIYLKGSVLKAVCLAFFVSVCVAFCFSGKHIEKTSSSVSIRLPVIMYHQISRSKSEKYIIRADELESDLAYLSKKGYATVTVKDLIAYVENNVPLPEKCVMLTFDDGHETVDTILYPLLKNYDMRAVSSIIGSLADLYTENGDRNDAYAYLCWDEIAELSGSGRIEFQNHSYDMHCLKNGKRRGMSSLKDESFDVYYANLYEDLSKNQLKLFSKTGINPTAVMYPYGIRGNDTLEACRRMGFKATFTCEEKINTIVCGDPNSLFELGRFNRAGGISSKDFFENIL